MIQGAINQLIGIAATAKKANDALQAKKAKAASRAQQAKTNAMQRMQQKVQEKWDQNEEFKRHIDTIGANAPDLVKQLAFEKWKEQPKGKNDPLKHVTFNNRDIDVSKFSPEAQAILREGVRNG